MADGIDFKMLTEPVTEFLAERRKRMPRAAMYAVREGGREVKKAAKAKTPVLSDKSVVTAAAYRRAYKQRKAGVQGPIRGEGGPVRGLLRQSISSSRRLKQLGPSEFSVVVAPRGPRAHLYAQKIEEQAHYMAAGAAAGEAALGEIAQRAYDRVWKE